MTKTNPAFTAIFILSLAIITACSSPQKKLAGEITAMEQTLYSDSSVVPDAGKARAVIALYTRYATEYPDDTSSASYLFKAGDISSKINETHQAIELFGTLIQKYPGHRHAPYALFLQGFIYENQVGDPMKAKPYYETFLKTYPDHPIASDVSFSLENLGKSPEQLIEEFENKLKVQNTQAAGDSGKVKPD